MADPMGNAACDIIGQFTVWQRMYAKIGSNGTCGFYISFFSAYSFSNIVAITSFFSSITLDRTEIC